MFLIDYLRDNPGMYLLFVTLVGLVVGSFLNVVVHRLPIMMQREWRAQCRELISEGEAPAEPGER
jgi:leader peptidase (prepilin peptidase)/N-methyltransferase